MCIIRQSIVKYKVTNQIAWAMRFHECKSELFSYVCAKTLTDVLSFNICEITFILISRWCAISERCFQRWLSLQIVHLESCLIVVLIKIYVHIIARCWFSWTYPTALPLFLSAIYKLWSWRRNRSRRSKTITKHLHNYNTSRVPYLLSK